jgi:hypothetical protein
MTHCAGPGWSLHDDRASELRPRPLPLLWPSNAGAAVGEHQERGRHPGLVDAWSSELPQSRLRPEHRQGDRGSKRISRQLVLADTQIVLRIV